MSTQVGYAAFLFFDATTVQQVSQRLDTHMPDRCEGVRVEVRTRLGRTELAAHAIELERLITFARALAGPGPFTPAYMRLDIGLPGMSGYLAAPCRFMGAWRIEYRAPNSGLGVVDVTNQGTLAECFDEVSLSTALQLAEGQTPTMLWVRLPDVEEADALRLFRRIGDACGTEPSWTGPDYLEVRFGDEQDETQSGVTYFRRERELAVASESVGMLLRALNFFGLIPILGEAEWSCARLPILRSRFERRPEGYARFTAGTSLAVDGFLRKFVLYEMSGFA